MSGFSTQVGQTPGTGTNDAANAGNVGELLLGLAPGLSITFTSPIASPGVVTQAGHSYSATGVGIFVPTTSGTLPTGLVSGTTYYTIPSTVTSTTFQLATSVANALAGTAINFTGTSSGTHTGKSLVAVANNTVAVLAAISLTAGDWDVSGLSSHVSVNTTTITALTLNLSTTIGGDFAGQSTVGLTVTFPATGVSNTLVCPPFRVSVAAGAAQIMYLITFDTFGVSSMTSYGKIQARRMR